MIENQLVFDNYILCGSRKYLFSDAIETVGWLEEILNELLLLSRLNNYTKQFNDFSTHLMKSWKSFFHFLYI